MAPHGALAHRIDAPLEHDIHDPFDLYARPWEWPGLKRRREPRRKYLTRWTAAAPARRLDPWREPQGAPSLVSLIEADMQVLFGEVWDLARAYPRTASVVFGLVVGFTLWG